MIFRALAAIALLALGGCASVTQPASLSSAQIVSKYGGAQTQEEGFYIDRYPGGTGSVSRTSSALDDHWSIDCERDKMSDKRVCKFSNKIGGPFVFYGSASQPQSVCILGHDFPGRQGQIRVDSNAPVTTDNDGCVPAARVLAQMKTGTQLITRRYEWPYDYPVDETTSLDGFAKTLEVVAQFQAMK